MATVLPMRPNTNSTGTSNSTASRNRRRSLSSFPSSKRSGSQSTHGESNLSSHQHTHSNASNPSSAQSYTSSTSIQLQAPARPQTRQRARPIKSQYPASSSEKHVEYILVASFDIDRGSVMEHQYPGPVGGDEHMLAELMLPDQTHLRSQDWTIFFLHKDADQEEEQKAKRKRRRRRKGDDGEEQADAGAEVKGQIDDENIDEEDDDDEEPEGSDSSDEDVIVDGPPLVYVLNLVNTKQDNTVKRGAIVKAMAICTRHSFLHIYKPLLLLALEQYFASPTIDTLASLYNAVNSMDLSLMPRLSFFERFILQASDAKDMFIEKFDAINEQRVAALAAKRDESATSPTALQASRSRYGLPRDTHEFESVVKYANVPVPIKVPTALSAETVGDFSLVKLITTFSTPHATAPQMFNPTHPHLTTSGPSTHPIIVLLNALLTQKRIIFLGHNMPSSEVAEAVLAACALASGGLLRGFTRHAFPYTDLTKIDDLLKVPGFIAGVTNPAFSHHTEWWDLLCDLSTGRMKVSNKIEQAPLTEGVSFFQPGGGAYQGAGHVGPTAGISAIAAAGASLSAGLGGNTVPTGTMAGDATGDGAFMQNVLRAIDGREGENAIRSKFRLWVLKFTRLSAAFEESVYGASALHVQPENVSPKAPFSVDSPAAESPRSMKPADTTDTVGMLPIEVTGHGYVWPTAQQKNHELAANATRIEGWRNTRSYYNFIQDIALFYPRRPVKNLDLQHLHDKLAKLRLGHEAAGNIYLAICAAVQNEEEISQLLAIISSKAWDGRGGPSGGGSGLFYLALGLFHPKIGVREEVAELMVRVQEHEAGRHFWHGLGRFSKMAWEMVVAGREARGNPYGDGEDG